jgi:phosphoribosylformimino-5-aminoimidazole carboxamide ribotide isomerase
VAARLGNRRDYAPISSPLCRSAEPAAVADALLRLYPFETLYLADLDAIAGGPGQWGPLGEIRRLHPSLELWVDNGLLDLPRLATLARPVLGSESLADLDALAGLLGWLDSPILLLDYRSDGPLGPPGLERRPDLWPADVVVMNLARVGSGQGPDLERLANLCLTAPHRRIYAAGGCATGRTWRACKPWGSLVHWSTPHYTRAGSGRRIWPRLLPRITLPDRVSGRQR